MPVPCDELDVLIVDDVELVADTVATALKFMFQYRVDTVTSTVDALKKLDEKGSYSAILLDFKMPNVDPYDAILNLHRQNGGRIAIFSGISDPETISKAKDAGATTFIPKDTPIAEIGAIIGEIASGRVRAFSGAHAKSTTLRPGPETALKERERKMLALLADGLDLAAVSAALGIAPAIASIDVRSICTKLASSTIDEALEKAQTLGLVGTRVDV